MSGVRVESCFPPIVIPTNEASGLLQLDGDTLIPRATLAPTVMVYRGTHSGATAYVVGDVVIASSILYRCISAHTNQTPPNGTYWAVLTSAGVSAHTGLSALAFTSSGHTGTANRLFGASSTGAAAEYPIARNYLYTDGYAILPRRAGQNFACPGLVSTTVAFLGNSSAIEHYGGRVFYKLIASGTSNGLVFAGFAGGSSADAVHLASSTSRYTWVFTFRTPAALTYIANAWLGVSNNSLTSVDTASTPNDTIAVHTTSTGALTLATKGVGSISTAALDETLAVDTIYALQLRWDGTKAYASIATINATTGVIGSFGTEKNIDSNLPTSTTVMYPQTRWWQGNSPPAAQSAHIGVMECRFAS